MGGGHQLLLVLEIMDHEPLHQEDVEDGRVTDAIAAPVLEMMDHEPPCHGDSLLGKHLNNRMFYLLELWLREVWEL